MIGCSSENIITELLVQVNQVASKLMSQSFYFKSKGEKIGKKQWISATNQNQDLIKKIEQLHGKLYSVFPSDIFQSLDTGRPTAVLCGFLLLII